MRGMGIKEPGYEVVQFSAVPAKNINLMMTGISGRNKREQVSSNEINSLASKQN